jgi:hypothetical protein
VVEAAKYQKVFSFLSHLQKNECKIWSHLMRGQFLRSLFEDETEIKIAFDILPPLTIK